MSKINPNLKVQLDNGAPNLSVYVERELQSVESTLYRRIERELFWEMDAPIDSSDPEGCDSVSYKRLGRYGTAKWINGSSQDLPSVGLYAEEFIQKVHGAGNSFGWDYFQMKSAEMAGFPLSAEEAEASRVFLNKFLADVTYFGGQNNDGPGNMFGLFNHPDITIYNLLTGTSGITWALKTADEIIEDIRAMRQAIKSVSKSYFKDGFTLLLPPGAIEELRTRKLGTDSAFASLYDYIIGGSFGITKIDERYELEEAALDGGGRAMLYVNSSEVVKNKIPMPIRALYEMATYQGLKLNVPAVCRTAGIQLKLPMGCLYADGIS